MWRRVLVVWSASRLAVLSLGYVLTAELGWHRALQPWQTQVGAGGHRLGLGLLHPHLARRLPARQARGVLPALPAAGSGSSARSLQVGDAVAALLVATSRCWPRSPGCTCWPATGCPRRTPAAASSTSCSRRTRSRSRWPTARARSWRGTVWMFVLSDRERDLAAVPLGFAASLTRVTGLALVAAARAARVAAADGVGVAARRGARRRGSAPRRPGCSTRSAIRSGWCTCRPSGAGIRRSR